MQVIKKEGIIVNETATQILGVGGSPRKNGNSDILLTHILKGAKAAGIDAFGRRLRDFEFKSCTGCEKCRKDKTCTGLNDGMTLLYPDILQCRGLVLVSPTHTYNVTALMKAFIDRLYCFYDFTETRPRKWSSRLAGQNRKAVICAICEQEEKENMGFTLDAMRIPLESHDYEIVDAVAVFGVFDRGKVKDHSDALDRAEAAGKTLARALAGSS